MNTKEVGPEGTSLDAIKATPVKKSNNQRFKEKHGYSKTLANLMKKYECYTPDQYRKIRKANRKKRRSL